ncbi:Uncharacterized protein Rs2_05338 [Raphanus sativus]|nr:Uncharacterized protein Rs2_05338 [Raphanus sativus]
MDAAKGILPRIFSLLCSPFLSLCVSTSTFRSDLAPASGRCVTVRTGAGVFFPSSQHSRFLFAAEVFSLSLSALSMALFSEAPDLAWSSRWRRPICSSAKVQWCGLRSSSSSTVRGCDGGAWSVAVIRCRGHRLCLLEVALPSMVLSRWRCDFPLLLSPSSRLLFQSPSEILEVGYWKGLWRLPMVWGVHPFLVFKYHEFWGVCGYILVP